MLRNKPTQSIDDFINNYPPEVQKKLQQLRLTIHAAAPGATEKISYGIPTFALHGNLVHFSAYEHHIGFYPGATPIKQFAKQLKSYPTAKGTVRFPIDKRLPLELIREMTLAAVKRNLAKKK